MNGKSVLIIGGGLRLEKAAEAFAADGCRVSVFKNGSPLKNAIDDCDIIVLGIPATNDDIYINSDELSAPISIKDLAMLVGKRRLVVGGRLSERMKALFDVYGVKWADYSMREEFEMMNAVPTAEGALLLALEEFPFTIHNANIIVTGFGRVSRALCKRLKALGGNVTVCARRVEARADAKSSSYEAIDFDLLPKSAESCDILFNTVPAKVINGEVLCALPKNCGVIDLASKPGGVDLEEAKSLEVNVIWALSIPGKTAPVTAGKIIEETVCNIADEMRL